MKRSHSGPKQTVKKLAPSRKSGIVRIAVVGTVMIGILWWGFGAAPSIGNAVSSRDASPTEQIVVESDARWTPACPRSGGNSIVESPAALKDSLKLLVDLMLGYGTRVAGSNSSGYLSAMNMIRTMAHCEAYWKVDVDSFTDVVVGGKVDEEKVFTNIIATSEFGSEENGHLVLSAHHDSKWFTNFHFVGASDSAVPCIMLLELMKRFSTLAALNASAVRTLPKVTVMFFDGEEAFYDWKGTDNTYGSRHLAAKWEKEGKIGTISLFMLLDLMGPIRTQFHNYFPDKTGPHFQQLAAIEANFKKNGALQSPYATKGQHTYFRLGTSYPGGVEDDHIPWLRRGVPVLHLIPIPFPPFWHQAEDHGGNVDYATVSDLLNVIWEFVKDYRSPK